MTYFWELYAGYSRWNLFLLPPFIAGSCFLFEYISEKGRIAAWSTAVIVIAVNLTMTPVQADGTRKPLWGVGRYDAAEHYYPYESTIRWLSKHHGDDKIYFTGMYYHYHFWLYFDRYMWHPEFEMAKVSDKELDDARNIPRMLSKARAGGFPVVVYHLLGKDIPEVATAGYEIERTFRNQSHTLIVYHR